MPEPEPVEALAKPIEEQIVETREVPEENIMITDAPVRQPITHEDLQTTPVPVFDCAFCLRDSQAQLQAFLDVGEKSLWHGWANKRRIEIAPNQADLDK